MTKNNAFTVCPLASGSKGNSLFVSNQEHAVLIDAGLSGVEVERRLSAVDISPDCLTGIIITHEHTDHVRGAGILSRRYDIPVYISQKTYQACKGLGNIPDLRFFNCGSSFKMGQIRINPFSTSHDARDPVGLTMEYNRVKIGIATDLGIATNLVAQHLKGSHLLYLESNHDLDMLMDGPYPWHLKQRIKGRKGHLSNEDAGLLVSRLMHTHLKHIILAHLSEENNCPDVAHRQMMSQLNGTKITLHVARPDKPGVVIKI